MHSSYKFALMQVVNSAPNVGRVSTRHVGINPDLHATVIDTAFYLLDAAELRDGANLAILQKCYTAFSALSEHWLNFRRELHMTDDKDLFKEHATAGDLPLFEGKMIWQYSHVFDAPQYWLNASEFDARMKSKELYRMAQDLGINKAEASKHEVAIRYDREFMRLGFRDIASDTNERTLIFGLVPKGCGVGNTINISIPIGRHVIRHHARRICALIEELQSAGKQTP